MMMGDSAPPPLSAILDNYFHRPRIAPNKVFHITSFNPAIQLRDWLEEAITDELYKKSDLGGLRRLIEPMTENTENTENTLRTQPFGPPLVKLLTDTTVWLDTPTQCKVGPYPYDNQRRNRKWEKGAWKPSQEFKHSEILQELELEDLKNIIQDLHFHHVAKLGQELRIRNFDWYSKTLYVRIQLSQRGLTSLPESLSNITLHHLDLSGNQLTRLPESFGQLRVGGYLDVSRNKLTVLPESFGQLRVGKDLDVSRNKLTVLPESFGQLRVGKNLDLSTNHLTVLPENFAKIHVGGRIYL